MEQMIARVRAMAFSSTCRLPSCPALTPGQHAQNVLHGAHVLQLIHLLEKVVQRKGIGAELALQLRSLFLIERGLRFLNQGKHVAHAQDAGSHAIRVKQLDIGEFLSYALQT